MKNENQRKVDQFMCVFTISLVGAIIFSIFLDPKERIKVAISTLSTVAAISAMFMIYFHQKIKKSPWQRIKDFFKKK